MSARQTENRCPICGKPVVARWRPFCSRRCGDIDLFRWFGGNYRVLGEPEPGAEGGNGSVEPE